MSGVCFCLRDALFGYAPRRGATMVWGCTTHHLKIAKSNYGKEGAMSEAEKSARTAAGRVAGEYLDSIGKTDLAQLTPEEWDIFLQAVIVTYSEAMTDAHLPI